MNAFHVVGGLTAVWALLVSFIGIKREGFPATRRSEIAVAVISITMFAGAVGTAIYTAIQEEDQGKNPEGPTALALPL